MTASDKLKKKNNAGKFICVGLDPDIKKIPVHLKKVQDPVFEFNKRIINETYENAAAFKLNFAFYESEGYRGMEILQKTIECIPKDILIIADAKRGDIGNTSRMYAKSVYEFYNCDAITINPYMGEDSVLPFLEYTQKLNFILTLTSNPGSSDFEKTKLADGSLLYQKVIKKIIQWNKNKNCAIVFGATNTEELEKSIGLFGELPVLLPGVGAQGGNLSEVFGVFKNNNRLNLLVNVSRAIIYKSNEKDFAEKANSELVRMNNLIKSLY